METKPLIVIVGPTASGKTALAIDLAKQVNGEIICADSRTVYEGLDIGTAKPTKAEQSEVPHWGIDLVRPDQKYSAADFKKYANEKINEIRQRNHVPFLVGGTGLYVDAVIFDYDFGPPANLEQRAKLESMTIQELHDYCILHNIQLPENKQNKRYVVRAIEQKSINVKRRKEPIDNAYVVGIVTEKEQLRERITQRANKIFTSAVVKEARMMGDKYGWECESMTGNIYPLCRRLIRGEITMEDAIQKFITMDWRLAKRQLTWLKRNPYTHWSSISEAKKYILALLASEH